MEVVLYSTHCPKCNVLTKKLLTKNISFTEVNDIDVMKEKGYLSVPILVVDGEALDFNAANTWINNMEV